MVYIEYNKCKKNYNKTYNNLNNYIDKKTMLFIKTLPSAVKVKGETITGGIHENPFELYVQKKDELDLDRKILEAQSILNESKRLLDIKELELRQSKDWYDIIYCYYFLDGLTIRAIARKIPYSKSQISRIIKNILKNLKMGQKGTKGMLR